MTESMQIESVSIPVSDQEQAKNFYVDLLGFELLADDSSIEGMRWMEVAPKGSTTSLMLVSWCAYRLPSRHRVLVLATDDIRALHEELIGKGISFDLAPTETCSGKQAMFRDPDGNAIVLWEHSLSALREHILVRG
jgi:catechol 2,3-dioxygenase-like lactoylglutathione lyase family enzyme